jgi:uncharacterized protein with HEPN domain
LSSEDVAFLRDIVESARLARSYVQDITEDEFGSSQLVRDAVAYRIGIIGEAARDVSRATAEMIPLDWRGMRGMRNQLFHGYRGVDVANLWDTATTDLDSVISAIEAFLQR